MLRTIKFLAIFVLLLGLNQSFAANYPELDWRVIKSKYCRIYYYQGTAKTALAMAEIADDVVEKVSAYYQQAAKGTYRIVLHDTEDKANAHAFYAPGIIDFWVSASLLPLRGRRNWLRGTFSHEFAHLVSLRLNSSSGLLFNGFSLSGIEDRFTKMHFDYGGSIYLPSNIYWRFWAEGVAQYDALLYGFDPFDSHRQMLLRMAFLEKNLLDYDQLHSIRTTKNFAGELIYNQGFSLIKYLEENYGPGFRFRWAKNQQRKWHLDADLAVHDLTGKDFKEIYEDWYQNLLAKYKAESARIKNNYRAGQEVNISLTSKPPEQSLQTENGPAARLNQANSLTASFPKLDSTGHWFAYSDRGILHLIYLEKKWQLPFAQKNDLLQFSHNLIGSYFAFHPQQPKLVLSRKISKWDGRYAYYDLFEVDLTPFNEILTDYQQKLSTPKARQEKKKLIKQTLRKLKRIKLIEKRISYQLRATHPEFSPDGKQLAFSKNADGSRSIWLMDYREKKSKPLIIAENGAQYIDPIFSENDSKIIFSRFGDLNSSIWQYDLKQKKLNCLICNDNDNRDARFCTKDKQLIFSSDRSGIFNLYRYQLSSGQAQQLTNLLGGAFKAYPLPGCQKILYSSFSSNGYFIAQLTDNKKNNLKTYKLTKKNLKKIVPGKKKKNYPQQKYYFELASPRVVPTIVLEDNFFKGGINLRLNDILKRHNLRLYLLFGKDQDYRLSYLAKTSWLDFHFSFDRYLRQTDFLSSSGLAVASDYVLDHLRSGFSLPLYARTMIPGWHTFDISFYRKNFNQRFGLPLQSESSAQTSSEYDLLTNNRIEFSWDFKSRYDTSDPYQDILPRDRRKISFKGSYVFSQVNPDLAADRQIAESYDRFYQLILSHREFISLPKRSLQTLELGYQLGYISRNVDSLDEFFAGGRINFRPFGDLTENFYFPGYEDFSISGETLIIGHFAYHFPLYSKIRKKIYAAYIDSLFASILGDIGNIWDFGKIRNRSDQPNGNILLYDVGFEMRLKSFLFSDYNHFNTILQIAYGFKDNAASGFRDNDWPLRFYFGIGVDF